MTSTVNGHDVAGAERRTDQDEHAVVGADHSPIRCVLEMNSDGHIAVIVGPDCSVPDVHDMLGLLALCEGQFEHLTFVDDEACHEPTPGSGG